MSINLGMWKNSLSELIKMDSKEEWKSLDVVSKWFIATRSAVTIVTIYSSAIGGLLAIRQGYFSGHWGMSIVAWLIVTLGLFLAHGTNNLLNDYTDFSRGIDSGNYFRTQYGVHPLIQGFWTKKQQLKWFAVSGFLAVLSGVFALFYTHFSIEIILFFAFGSVVLLFYTWPIEIHCIRRTFHFSHLGTDHGFGSFPCPFERRYRSILAGGAGRRAIRVECSQYNLGKHTDKFVEDKKKHVGTLPVVIGQKAARMVNIVVIGLFIW